MSPEALYAHALSAPAMARLNKLSPLSRDQQLALNAAFANPRNVKAQREIQAEESPVLNPLILRTGWAGRVRHFSDGRRQILGLLLPGDLIGIRRQRHPVAATTIVALTDVTVCSAPDAIAVGDELNEAYAISGALEEFYWFRQIVRLGRMTASDRILDWLLELRERLALADLLMGEYFPMPLTQEAIADTLGLTNVHVNRTLQALRRQRIIELANGCVRLFEPNSLAREVEFRPAMISAPMASNWRADEAPH